MNILEIEKKHGATYSHDYLLMTTDQLKAIIKEASQPLVNALMELEQAAIYSDENFYGSVDGRFIIKICLEALEQFNKEYVE